jgi:hypothetical protein
MRAIAVWFKDTPVGMVFASTGALFNGWSLDRVLLSVIVAAKTALAKCPSENWPSWLKKMAVIRALSLELSRIRPLTFGNLAQFAVA